jgi:hypothetical protein
MDDFPYPENPWLDDEILLGGLAIVNQTLAAFLQNVIDVKQGKAQPFTAVQVASIGSSMVETGNALQSRILNNLPKDWPVPPLHT